MNFIDYVKDFCIQKDIEIVESEADKVTCYGIRCNGFFDDQIPAGMSKEYILGNSPSYDEEDYRTKMVLAYAKGGKTEEELWGLIAHEFGHANQCLEKCEFWMKSKEFEQWDKYFKSKKISWSDIHKVWQKIVILEADCENRVLAFVDEFGLKIDKANYARKANAYLYFYHFSLKNKKWYKRAPYEISDIVQAMPDKIMPMDFYTNLENTEISTKEKLFRMCF